MAKKKGKPTPAEPKDEGRRGHLTRYYDPGKPSAVDSLTVNRWQFEQAMTNLIMMLQSADDIDVDWSMDDDAIKGRRTIEKAAAKYRGAGSRLPYPGVAGLCTRTADNAIRNYVEMVTTWQDACELSGNLPRSKQIMEIQIVLSRLSYHLHHEGPDYSAKMLVADGHEREAVTLLRDVACRAREDVLPDLKRLMASYDVTGNELSGKIGETGDQKREAPTLDDTETDILICLRDKGTLMIQEEIAQVVPKGDGTIKKAMGNLERWGFVRRPRGKRKGYTITEKGKLEVK